jgi:hypothetical protein
MEMMVQGRDMQEADVVDKIQPEWSPRRKEDR